MDPALLLGEQVLPFLMPLSVGRLAAFARVGAALKEPADPVGQLATIVGLHSDVVGGVGLGVASGDEAARELGGLAVGAAARHVHTRLLVGVFVFGFAGLPLIQGVGPRLIHL